MYVLPTDWDTETEKRVQIATDYFKQGYNCSQSVALAFADLYGIPLPLMAHLSASYGGGIGRMRETCGSALGIFMLAGLEVVNVEDTPCKTAPSACNDSQAMSDICKIPTSATGEATCPAQNTPVIRSLYPNQELKKKNYEVVQRLAADFRKQTGSIICKELLGLNKKRADGTIPEIPIVATPEPRTDDYYRKRPCIRMVETATRVYMNYLRQKYTSQPPTPEGGGSSDSA